MKKQISQQKRTRRRDSTESQKSMSSGYDVNGSYTGVSAYNDHSAPTQDADDL